MTPESLTAYLHEHIPLTAALGARVVLLSDEAVEISAPLAPNRNHRSTAFGGSLATLAILSGWTLLQFGLRTRGIEARLVIQRSDCDYLLPVDGDFVARSTLAAEAWPKFVGTLQRYAKARITVDSVIRCGEQSAVKASGTFVALMLKDSS